jgi:hypothetical protein
MKRIAFAIAFIFVGSIALTPRLRAQEQVPNQDQDQGLDQNYEDDSDGGRQLREFQQPEVGFHSDSLDDQKSLDSSYTDDDASTNADDSSLKRKNRDDQDQTDQPGQTDQTGRSARDGRNTQNQDDQDQDNQDQAGSGDSIDQAEMSDPAERPDAAEQDDPAARPDDTNQDDQDQSEMPIRPRNNNN